MSVFPIARVIDGAEAAEVLDSIMTRLEEFRTEPDAEPEKTKRS